MLPLEKIKEVRKLLDDGGHSQRAIARSVGVSRGTVAQVASGARGLYGREPGEQHVGRDGLSYLPERCGGCGGLVRMPCLLCRARAHAKRKRAEDLLAKAMLAKKNGARCSDSCEGRCAR
ncbi:MAG: helix-turn-helix domain-containing protein [Planctomycetota bacterium]